MSIQSFSHTLSLSHTRAYEFNYACVCARGRACVCGVHAYVCGRVCARVCSCVHMRVCAGARVYAPARECVYKRTDEW